MSESECPETASFGEEVVGCDRGLGHRGMHHFAIMPLLAKGPLAMEMWSGDDERSGFDGLDKVIEGNQ